MKPCRIAWTALVLAAAATLLPAVARAAALSADRIIVKWRNADATSGAVSDSRVNALSRRLARPLGRGRNIGGGMSVVQLPAVERGNTLAATLEALRADPDVELAEPDRWVKIQSYTPSDPLFADAQWYLGSTEISAIRVGSAWDITRGGASPATSTVVVAVIDTGVRLNHPDLAGKLLPGYDFVSASLVANDGDGWDADPTDPGDYMTVQDLADQTFAEGRCGAGENRDQPTNSSWHGTKVSGLIAANTDNGAGIAGAGFNIRLLPVRVLGKCGGFESDVLAGMYWAAGITLPPPLLKSTDLPVNAHPAQILNMSLGSEGACSSTYATAVRDVTARGVLVVASAGNDGKAVGTPASCPGALAVAGVRHAGTKVGYSNLGAEVGIAAPAGNCVNILADEPCVFALNSTTNLGTQAPGAEGYATPLIQPTFGTSFSSPLVAATAGLMKTVNPALTPAVLISRIKQTARPFPIPDGSGPAPPACMSPEVFGIQGGECVCSVQLCGAGMLDAGEAVSAALRPAALARVSGTVRAGRAATLDGSASAAAVGRSIASYAWTVDATAGGAALPVIEAAGQAIATVDVPTAGSITLRLTVMDDQGASDSATVNIAAAGAVTPSSPPPAAESGGGGWSDAAFLALLLLWNLCNRRRAGARA